MTYSVENLINHYQKTLLIKPDNAAVYSELGKLYAFQGEHEKVPYHYIKTIEFDPGFFKAYWDLKYSLLRLNCCDMVVDAELLGEGIEILRKAAEKKPDFPFSYVALGDLLTQKGDKQEAIDCYQKASQKQMLLSRPKLVSEAYQINQKSKPSFLILGFMRCGTSSLYEYLFDHPQALHPVDKELWFFTNFFNQGIDWYLAHFPSIANGMDYITGEATPFYVNHPDVATKVLSLFPDMKFIILLRNPVARLISSISLEKPLSLKNVQLEHDIISGLEKAESVLRDLPEVSLSKLSTIVNCDLSHQGMVSITHLLEGLYILYLKEWMTIFPKNQFLILKSEDLFKDTLNTMNKVHSFLEISDYQLVNYRNSNPGTYPSVSNDLYRRIAAFYRPYNQQLEEYLGMRFDWE